MLVLTRRVGETIRIGDEVSIKVLEVQRGQIRLAIDAPRHIAIHREEIYQQVQEENRRAALAVGGIDAADVWRRSKKGRR